MYSYKQTTLRFTCKLALCLVFVLGNVVESSRRRLVKESLKTNQPKEYRDAKFIFTNESDNTDIFVCKKARNGLLKWGAALAAAGTPIGLAGAAVATTIAAAGALGTFAVGNGVQKGAGFGFTEYRFAFKIQTTKQAGSDPRKVFVELADRRKYAINQDPQYAEVTMIGKPDKKKKRVKLVLRNLEPGRVCDRWIYYGKGKAGDELDFLKIITALYNAQTDETSGQEELSMRMRNTNRCSGWNKLWSNSRFNTSNKIRFKGRRKGLKAMKKFKEYIQSFISDDDAASNKYTIGRVYGRSESGIGGNSEFSVTLTKK